MLRDVLDLRGTKYGCGIGYCAACTVLIDGRNTTSCQMSAERATGKVITTVEGVSGLVIDAVRNAWYRRNVVRCGYCQPGQTLAAAALLESDKSPDDAAIGRWMNGNLRRCGTYRRIRDAIGAAAEILASGRTARPPSAAAEPEMPALTPKDLADPLHPYIRTREDGTVVAYSNQIEMGQGAHTGLATIVAEELDADIVAVRVLARRCNELAAEMIRDRPGPVRRPRLRAAARRRRRSDGTLLRTRRTRPGRRRPVQHESAGPFGG